MEHEVKEEEGCCGVGRSVEVVITDFQGPCLEVWSFGGLILGGWWERQKCPQAIGCFRLFSAA